MFHHCPQVLTADVDCDVYDEIDEREDRIEEGDWTTDDGNRFYQDGRLVLDASDMTDEEASDTAGRIMRKAQFWPNIWFVSDHGNLHPFTF